MSTTTIDEIRARHAAIIPGPWRWYGNTATDQVFLATTDRGRLFVLMPSVRTEEYVLDYRAEESTLLSAVSNTKVREWCGAHNTRVREWGGVRDELSADDDRECLCAEITRFLSGTMESTDERREFSEGGVLLTRGVRVSADLRFPVTYPAPEGVDPEAHRKQHGGIMRSYRDCGPKYEVLGYRSVIEWEMDQGGGLNARESLYREDFTGLEQPEATFIEHAPEDIAFLLAEVDQLREKLSRTPTLYECPECGTEVDTLTAESL